MAKRIVLVLALAAAALVAYNYMTTGKIALMPSATLSDEEKELDGLETRVRQAASQYAQAGRAAGLSGMDTTSDAESARVEVQKIAKRVDEIGRKVSASAKEKFAKVKQVVEQTKAAMDIR